MRDQLALPCERILRFQRGNHIYKNINGRQSVDVAEDSPGMNHVNTMFKSDTNNVILSKIGSNGCQTLSDLIRFICLYTNIDQPFEVLCKRNSINLLTVSRQTILEREDRNGVHCKFMRSSEHTDSNLLQKQPMRCVGTPSEAQR
jgi:hypothetical protein